MQKQYDLSKDRGDVDIMEKVVDVLWLLFRISSHVAGMRCI